jgi:hypothetical protein
MGSPARFPNGIGTAVKGTLMGNFPLPDPLHTSSSAKKDVYVYVSDYNDLGAAASRTITGAGTTLAPINGLGGRAVLTPGGAAVVSTVARTAATFQFITGNEFWYQTRFQLSGVGAGVITCTGVQNGSGASTTNDGLYFTKTTGAGGAVALVSQVGGVATTLVSQVLTSTTAATDIDVGFYYDGNDLLVFAADALVARVASPTIGASGTTLSNALMQPFYQITPVATETYNIDYELCACEFTR